MIGRDQSCYPVAWLFDDVQLVQICMRIFCRRQISLLPVDLQQTAWPGFDGILACYAVVALIVYSIIR
jgi:hypothetical protein